MNQRDNSGRVAGALLALALRMPGAWEALRRGLEPGPDSQSRLGALLAADDFALLRAFLDDFPQAGRGLLQHTAPDVLSAYLSGEGHAQLLAYLQQDEAAIWKVLAENQHERLKELLAADDYALFRQLAQAGDSAPLKRILFGDDYAVLRRILRLNGYEALKAVVLEAEPDWFSLLVRAHEGQPLASVLFEQDGALLRRVCQIRGAQALLPLLREAGPTYVGALPADEQAALLQDMIARGATAGDTTDPGAPTFPEQVLESPRVAAMAALARKWRALSGVVPADDAAIDSRFRAELARIQSPDHVRGRVLDAITEGDIVRLAHGSLQFPCRHSLWTLIHEILLNEDYYFECETDAPVIIDGGTHMGMAIYYFKTRYPKARITAFEPEPSLRAMAEGNVARNGYTGVTVLPYALAGDRRSATFHVAASWSMAGSLTDRRAQFGDDTRAITVECVPLRDYLDGPVDFLKLDIEGAEDEVLVEAAPKLGNVRHIFCEFHQGGDLASGRLATILGVLDGAGFDVQVGKSHNYQETSRRRPFTHLGGSASMVIFGRRG